MIIERKRWRPEAATLAKVALIATVLSALFAVLLPLTEASASETPERELEGQITHERSDGYTRPGDANCSGDVDIIDAMLVVRYEMDLLSGGTTCPVDTTEINLLNADVDRSGVVDIIDALIIMRCVVGIDTEPCTPTAEGPIDQDPIDQEPVDQGVAPNDDIAGAIEIVPTVDGASVAPMPGLSATNNPYEPSSQCAPLGRSAEGSVWHKFVAPESGYVSILSADPEHFVSIYGQRRGVDVAPTSAGDLDIVICGPAHELSDVVLQPGTEYWVLSRGNWNRQWWLFGGPANCMTGDDGLAQCPGQITSDDISGAIALDVSQSGPLVVPVNPDSATYGRGEPDPEACIPPLGSGTVWYSFFAPDTGIKMQFDPAAVTPDYQTFAIYEIPHSLYQNTFDENVSHPYIAGIPSAADLDLVACASSGSRPLYAPITRGRTHLIAVSGGAATAGFTIEGIDASTIAPNDQIVNAIEVYPSPQGYLVTPEAHPAVIATTGPGEGASTCVQRGGGQAPTVWYRFVAETSQVWFHPTNDDQTVGVFRAEEGVSDPQTADDLVPIACGEITNITGTVVQPGETYWIKMSGAWRQDWSISSAAQPPCRYAEGCYDPGLCLNHEGCSPHELRSIAAIDVLGPNPVLRPDWPYHPAFVPSAELIADGCTAFNPEGPELTWAYRFVATKNTVTIEASDLDDRFIAIYEPVSWTTAADELGDSHDDLRLKACSRTDQEPGFVSLSHFMPGQTYVIVTSGEAAKSFVIDG